MNATELQQIIYTFVDAELAVQHVVSCHGSVEQLEEAQRVRGIAERAMLAAVADMGLTRA